MIDIWLLYILHAGWKFLGSVLGRDSSPLKFLFLLNVQSLAFFKKIWILIAGGGQKVQNQQPDKQSEEFRNTEI